MYKGRSDGGGAVTLAMLAMLVVVEGAGLVVLVVM